MVGGLQYSRTPLCFGSEGPSEGPREGLREGSREGPQYRGDMPSSYLFSRYCAQAARSVSLATLLCGYSVVVRDPCIVGG